MQKSSGDPICTGFLVDASAGLCPAGMALLKRYMHLFSCIGLPAAVGTAPAPINKNRNIPQPEGSAERKSETTISTRAVRRSETPAPPVTRRPAASWRFSGSRVPSLLVTDWAKGRGSSPKGAGAFSVHFCAYKSEPGVRGWSPRWQAPAPGVKPPLASTGSGDGAPEPKKSLRRTAGMIIICIIRTVYYVK